MSLVHLLQLLVQELGSEIDAVLPGNRCESVVEIESGEELAVAQRRAMLAVQLIREIHHAFASIVELQPDLVVPEIACFHDMPG